MKDYDNVFLSLDRVCFILGQQGMERPDELVHSCHHSLPMRKSFLPFLVVVRMEDNIVSHAAVSHQIQVLAQQWISPLGYLQGLAGVSRLVDTWISAGKRDELLVGGELGDVGDFGKEMRRSHFADTGNGGENLHLTMMQGLLELHQSLSELLVSLLACEHCLGTVANHGGTVTDPDRDTGEFLDFLDGNHVTLSSFLYIQSLLQLFFSGSKHVLGTTVDTQEFQQGLDEDVEAQQLRECHRQVALEDGLGLGKVLGVAGSAPGEHLAFAVELHPLLLQCAHVRLCIPGDGNRIESIGLGPSERLPVMKVLDEQRINDTNFPAVVQEKVVERQVIASSGFHHEQRCIAYLLGGDEGRESVVVEGERTLASDSLGSQNAECGSLAGDIQCNDGHKKTSCGLESGSRFPVSRLKEARWPNQPIGKFGTEDRLLVKFKDLNIMRSSVPELYHQKSITYRQYR